MAVWTAGIWTTDVWADTTWEGCEVATTTTTESSGVGGGTDLGRGKGAGRRRIKPLPYYVGLEITFTGPSMPTVSGQGRYTKQSAPVLLDPQVVFSPRPQLAPAPDTWSFQRKALPPAGLALNLTGPSLPTVLGSLAVRDVEGEAVLSLLKLIEAYD